MSQMQHFQGISLCSPMDVFFFLMSYLGSHIHHRPKLEISIEVSIMISVPKSVSLIFVNMSLLFHLY